MDLKTMIAAVPWLRKAWRWTPRFLRLPLVLVAIGVAIWYFGTGRHREQPEQSEQAGDVARGA